jgi:Ca2+-transporting ATPase
MPSRPIPFDRFEGLPLADRGLSSEEAAARAARYGPNDIVETPPGRWRELVADTARDPMLWFLVGAGALFAVLGDYGEAATLLVALAPLIGMDAWLHRRTQASTQGLASRLAAHATVVRDGAPIEVPARELVPGDLVLVGPGEPIAADGLVVAGSQLQADESTLTGESLPVRKLPVADVTRGRRDVDDGHWVFAGTRLLAGQGRLRVAYTGKETLYGEIVRSALAGAHARTPLQSAVGNLVGVMLVAATILCVALAAIRLRQGYGIVDAALSAVTLAVAALPEEFPVVFTFFLGVGVYRLARRQALVRRAVAVENIGRVSCICSDKTGTLTEGRLVLAHQVPAEGETAQSLLRVAALAARPDSGDPLDEALLAAAGDAAADAPAPAGQARVSLLAAFPFTEDRRRETAVLRLGDGSGMAVVKGAPETVLAMCEPLAHEALGRWRAQVEGFAATGHKVIACAARPMDEGAWPGGEPDRGFRMAGLLCFEDKLREGVRESIRACEQAGIRVVMITGDHPVTAEAVAREIGLGGAEPVVAVAPEHDSAGAGETAQAWHRADVIARAAPARKLELVRRLQASGEIVAVTGDGVNDVPALQAADIGVAMGERGTRSAREVASIVLLDDNFRTIVRAIGEGRQLFRNLQLSFAYVLMTHIPLVLSATIVPLAGYPLLYLPIHVVWLELIIHPTALLVFQELPASEVLLPIKRDGRARFFGTGTWVVIGVVGLMVTAVTVAGYDYALGAGRDVEHARAMAMTALVVASATITVSLGGLRSLVARVLVACSLASLFVMVQVDWLASLLHLRPLHGDDLALAALGGLLAGAGAVAVRMVLQRPARGADRISRAG